MVVHKKRLWKLWRQTILCSGVFGLLSLVSSCFGSGASDDPSEDFRGTPISYPFVSDEKPLDTDVAGEKFVIRSAVGPREYAIEIPGAAQDFDVQVPIGDLGAIDPEEGGVAGKPRDLPNPRQTDQELMGAMPRLDKSRGADTSLMDQAFGVGSAGGPRQGPSYTLGIARINRYYKDRQLEYCLVEINSLLSFYPTATQLHKMKGTVLLKMRQFKLAEQAWVRALQLDPTDKSVKKALYRLQKRLSQSGEGVTATSPPESQAGANLNTSPASMTTVPAEIKAAPAPTASRPGMPKPGAEQITIEPPPLKPDMGPPRAAP